MPEAVENLEGVEAFLRKDPLRRARLIREIFGGRHPVTVYADDPEDPRFVMSVRQEDWNAAGLWSEDDDQLPEFLDLLPPGEWFFGAVQDPLAPRILERLTDLQENERSHLYSLAREDFVSKPIHPVRPLRPEEAETVDQYWDLIPDAGPYIRRRIEAGISFGAEADGELVAWDLTHFETEEAVMLGMLHVLDAYRRQGYAWAVGSAVVDAVFAKGKTPICYVYDWNEPSVRFTLAMGFQLIDSHHWIEGTLR